MNSGLLWEDFGPGDLAAKVCRAARKYREKHSAWPNVCYVHPTAFAKPGEAAAQPKRVNCGGYMVEVRPRAQTARDNFWIGENSREKE